jgi:threonine aldolase
MRRAMAEADVGDDVYREDPTALRLEELAAEMLEFPAALFVPTGTMGNQLAVHLQTRPGSEVIIEARGHIFNFEMGAMAVWSGALPRPIVTQDGLLEPSQVENRDRPGRLVPDPTRLLALENTHNLWSGLPMDAARTGPRGGRPPPRPTGAPRRRPHLQRRGGSRHHRRRACTGCDTLMFCLSKGSPRRWARCCSEAVI